MLATKVARETAEREKAEREKAEREEAERVKAAASAAAEKLEAKAKAAEVKRAKEKEKKAMRKARALFAKLAMKAFESGGEEAANWDTLVQCNEEVQLLSEKLERIDILAASMALGGSEESIDPNGIQKVRQIYALCVAGGDCAGVLTSEREEALKKQAVDAMKQEKEALERAEREAKIKEDEERETKIVAAAEKLKEEEEEKERMKSQAPKEEEEEEEEATLKTSSTEGELRLLTTCLMEGTVTFNDGSKKNEVEDLFISLGGDVR